MDYRRAAAAAVAASNTSSSPLGLSMVHSDPGLAGTGFGMFAPSPLGLLPPPKAATPAPRLPTPLAAPKPPPPPSSTNGQSGRNPSFAAALRNLAKNATTTTPDSSMSSSVKPHTTTTTTPTTPTAAQPSADLSSTLLDVRKGFDRGHAKPVDAALPVANGDEVQSLHSGFKPYRPDTPSKVVPNAAIQSLSALSYPSLHPSYAAAAAAAAAGYHPAMFGSVAYSLEAEALYRAQLERYALATGMIRPPVLNSNLLGAPPPYGSPQGLPTPDSYLISSVPSTTALTTPPALTSSPKTSSTSVTHSVKRPKESPPRRKSMDDRERRKLESKKDKREHHARPSGPPNVHIQSGLPDFNFNSSILKSYLPGLLPVTSANTKTSLPSLDLWHNSNGDQKGLVNGINPDIRLPTQPLDITEVAKVSLASNNNNYEAELKSGLKDEKIGIKEEKKLPFVRPFEDDYNKKTSANKIPRAGISGDTPSVAYSAELDGGEDDKATLHYSGGVVQVPISKCLDQNSALAIDEFKLPTKPVSDFILQGKNDALKSDDAISKEKLRYLRYFRLITHKKRNDVEIEKLEKRRARYLERSPSPITTTETKYPSPSLPLPSKVASITHSHDSSRKQTFMRAVGLNSVTPSERAEMEESWNVILEERLSRDSESTSVSYFQQLRDASSCRDRKRCYGNAFLHPSLIENKHNGVGSISPIPSSKLPINFATLMPVPLGDMTGTEATPAMPSAILNTPLSFAVESFNPPPAKKRVPIIPWPGVEAIQESFKNYLKDCRDEKNVLNLRLQEIRQELLAKRCQMNSLTSQLSALARQQKEHNEETLDLEAKLQRMQEVLTRLQTKPE